MLLTDLRELKTELDIDPDNTNEDKKLNFLVEQATKLIEEYINRPGLSYRSRTEYYNGSGTQKLLLRSRPVFTTPTIQVFVDEAGWYGVPSDSFLSGTALTWGDDFTLWIDQDDGSSRCGILVRRKDYWPRPQVRQRGLLSPFVGTGFGNVKVVYTAGFTVDTLPAPFRLACNLLVGKLRYILPLAAEIGSDSYEDRSISIMAEKKGYLLGLVKPLLFYYRNWKF